MYDPPSKSAQAHCISRLFLVVCIVIHRLNHISTAKADLNFYKSLKHFRNAASKRQTFHSTMVKIARLFLCKATSDRSTPDSRSGPVIESATSRMTQSVASVQPVHLGDAARILGQTPKRKVQEKYSRLAEKNSDSLTEVEKQILERRSTCLGFPLYGIPGTCNVCKKETAWFCVLCHHNFCLSSYAEGEIKTLQVPMIDEKTGETVTKEGRFTCYCKAHVNAIESYYNSGEQSRRISF
jgi:hypothetical protein